MNILSWSLLVLALSLATYGSGWTITLALSVLTFLIGAFVLVFEHSGSSTTRYIGDLATSCLPQPKCGLPKALGHTKTPQRVFKCDHRLTGSSVIDESLQEILGYLLRDYVYPWWLGALKAEGEESEEFLYELRQIVHKVVIALAARVKEVDWVPYLTTTLVDDVASHLRLFRQSRTRLRECKKKEEGKGGDSSKLNLEEIFFEMESAMEGGHISRKELCMEERARLKCLCELCEPLLFLVLPAGDFGCRPVLFMIRTLFVQAVLVPALQLLSDPDFLNQMIITLCHDIPVVGESFLCALRVTESVEELQATKELLNKEMSLLRSKDTGGDDDTAIKQQLRSLQYLRKVIDNRCQRLQEGSCETDSGGLPSLVEWNRILMSSPGHKLLQLPLDVILRNGLALSYFMDHMASVDAQHYLFAYLNMEGWKISAEQQLCALHHGFPHDSSLSSLRDGMKEAANSIYQQYFDEKATPRVVLDETITRRLLQRITAPEPPSDLWFDEAQTALYHKLQTEDLFLPAFKCSLTYVRLLAELDLLREPSRSDEEDSLSLEEVSWGDSASLNSLDAEIGGRAPSPSGHRQILENAVEQASQPFTIIAEVFETGVVQDHGKTYGIYAIAITQKFQVDHTEKLWHIYRRYSDFYDLFQKVKDKYGDLAGVPFPAKKAFNNTDRATLEARMQVLNAFLSSLLQAAVLHKHPLLQSMVLKFLDGKEYDPGKGVISRKLDTLLKQSVRSFSHAVRSVPDGFVSTVDGMVDGLSRALMGRGVNAVDLYQSSKVGASLEDTTDNIPLRIMMLLMDEVFDLKSRNQWLRRRIVAILRQIVKSMFGDIVNRRIVEYVALLTGPERVAEYLRIFKQSLWPGGSPSAPAPPRDDATKLRTQVAAKAVLLSSLSDELRHILGSETTRRGILLTFELLQHPVLNQRLLFVIMEGALHVLFPERQLPTLFEKVYSGNINKKR